MSSANMDPGKSDGPDGSSIKPVSSLLARFENMNKSQPSSSQSQPPSRPISPRPKPEKLQNFRPSQDAAAPSSTVPPKALKPPETLSLTPVPTTTHEDTLRARPTSLRPPPTPNSKPPGLTIQTPSVLIQPPQSPPKGAGSGLAGDQSPFLDPQHGFPPTTPKPLKIPPPPPSSRPRTPTPSFAASRSPRLGTSLPPSPPPPRRSGEMKRDRDGKVAPPSPVPRTEKSDVSILQPFSLPEPRGGRPVKRGDVSQETSPFNSPPGSTRSEEDEVPPELPTRPRPAQQKEIPSKNKGSVAGFNPPPVHHIIADKRRGHEQSVNGISQGHITSDLNVDSRPALPTRPIAHEQSRPQAPIQGIKSAPKPLRTIPANNSHISDALTLAAPTSRIVPSPQSQQPHLPPPTRRHDQAKILDKPLDRASHDVGSQRTPITATTKSVEPVSVPDTSTTDGLLTANSASYPDGANTNRRPPYIKSGGYQLQIKYDARVFDVCGELVCTSGQLTRVWNLVDGEQLLSLAHTEGTKATAVIFKPASDPEEEGSKLWIGTNLGEIMEVDVAARRITFSKPGVHGRLEVIRMYRNYNELWTLDEGGNLLVWGPDKEDATPNLKDYPAQSYKVPRGHTFSMVIEDHLWHATGKAIRIFAPTLDGRGTFQVLIRPLAVEGAGDVTSGTLIKTKPGKVLFGHVDGKISMYSTKDFSCQGIFNISSWKINALASTGQYLWAGYNTGKIGVYDTSQSPWIVMKEWQAHDNPVIKMKTDSASPYKLDRLQVVSLGTDSKIKAWDGMLQDDWIEDEMKSKDTKYCTFSQISTMVMTWNAGAATPYNLRYAEEDVKFVHDLLQSSGSPDILVFGFQELVDLEDKTATAKRLLKSKKKEGTDQEKMSHRYRDWRDFLLKTLDDYFPADDLYHLLHNAPMVGLFTCVFVKASMRERIRNLNGAEVKRGMGGLHGNKGAITVRFQVDDSSLCFVNCHLAAGQSQANARHTDIAAILETNVFPTERDPDVRIDTYTGGGDGSMILDHELCIINGDLNYRIDTMSRDTVVKAVQADNLPKLLERDQLLVARRRNPMFRLRAFEELPITFAPTYKYDVGTDTYDTSEKRRSPAWCDRILYRGRGRIEQLDYKRHEVRVSDHRPVSGNFLVWVKKVDPKQRAIAWMESQQSFEEARQREVADEKLTYLTHTCGFDEETSKRLIKERSSKRVQRSPSRNRDR